MDRRHAIAQAAIEIIATDGLRGLTHRAVDREAGLPEGTTSNYARTRRDLIDLVVGRMAEGTAEDVVPRGPRVGSLDQAVDALVAVFDRASARTSEARARFALSLELASEPDLHAVVTTPAVRGHLLQIGEELLAGLGVEDAALRSTDLVGLLNGLLYDRIAGHGLRGAPVDVRAVLTAWLIGVGAERA